MLTWDDWGKAVACRFCDRVVQPDPDPDCHGIGIFGPAYVDYRVCCVPLSHPDQEGCCWEWCSEEDRKRWPERSADMLKWPNTFFKQLGRVDACECGAFKTYKAPRGDRAHSSWCPWAK